MSKAEQWCNAHGFDDGQEWGGFEAALDNAHGVISCRWALITDDGDRETFPGYVWLEDNSGVYMTEAWWDIIADGTCPGVWPHGRVEGPL